MCLGSHTILPPFFIFFNLGYSRNTSIGMKYEKKWKPKSAPRGHVFRFPYYITLTIVSVFQYFCQRLRGAFKPPYKAGGGPY